MNHAARHRHEQTPPGKWGGYAGVPLVILATIILAPRLYRRWFLPDDSWPAFLARVVATRVVTVGISDNPRGSSFVCRLEVDAAWTEEGERREAWVPTTKTSRCKESLAFRASQQKTICAARENPRNRSFRLAFF
ncbi:MAG TPA: hypothetical protein VME18_13510 [Acidobacteriaceae bacterium]|nr:hypothetical protein [Acidobacteriaceae bacterium]